MIFLIRTAVIILIMLSCLSFFTKPKQEEYSRNLGHSWEEYNPLYFSKFQSIQSIINYADSGVGRHNRNSVDYYNSIAKIIRKRFYHAYSSYQFSDNPLAYLSGRFIWDHLSAIVDPDDIMKHPMAACSQQSIVLAEIFKRNKIKYRKVSFEHHFALEGFINNGWHYFDVDMEPQLDQRESLESLIAANKLIHAYAYSGLDTSYLHQILGKSKTGTVNESLAPNASLFHKTCSFMVSKWFLFFAFIVAFWRNINKVILKRVLKQKREKRMEKETPLAMAS